MIVAVMLYSILPSLQERTIRVKKLMIMPAIFSYMLYQTITKTFYLDLSGQLFLMLGLGAGIIIGILLRQNTIVKADRREELICLPGTWINLVMFVLIFCVHYIIGYLQSVSPHFFHQSTNGEISLLFLLACVSSISIGANSCLYYKYLNTDKTIDQYARR